MLDIPAIRKYEALGWNYTPYHPLPKVGSTPYDQYSSQWLRVLCLDLMPKIYTGMYNSAGYWVVQGIDEEDDDRIYLSPNTITLQTEDVDFWRYLSREEIDNLFIQYRRS